MRLLRKLQNFPHKLSKHFRRLLKGNPDDYLANLTGIIHVGANIGQERFRYADRNLDVIWIEPIPTVFTTLESNIRPFPKQIALKYLLSNETGQQVNFHVASNNGESSSMFEFGLHKVMRPDITMTEKIVLESSTLDNLVSQNKIQLSKYQALLLDTQGSELLVLQGARNSLTAFDYIKVEASNFAAYNGGCVIADIAEFMQEVGFVEIFREPTSKPKDYGQYFELIYERQSSLQL